MEAHLSQYHQIDIRDRDIVDEHGRRKLTLAMIAARIRYRPEGNPIDTARNGGVRPPSRVELLLSDLFELQTGERSPRLAPAERAAVQTQERTNPEREALRKQRSREAAERRRNTAAP